MTEDYPRQSNHPELDFTETTARSQTLNNKAIFRQLIGEELRNGRLSAYRRRRIVQYAAHLGLSAKEMGEMIERCSYECYNEANSFDAPPQLHLVEAPDYPSPTAIAACLFGLAFILIGVAYIVFA